jgi:hypothetical protein
MDRPIAKRIVEIPQERWPSFLKMLNRLAAGRAVRLEVAHRDLGDQELGNLLPLRELGYETKGSERGRLEVTVGSDRGELTHAIDKPMRMSIGVNEASELQWLGIDEGGGAATILHFAEMPKLEAEYGATP